jgi:N-acetylglucosaminyldiphosphoundecaprenol N-acetyl-beta-D-mannosaminyltransferase
MTAPRIEFLGLPFDRCETNDMLDWLHRRAPTFSYVVTPNAAHIVKIADEPDLLPVYRGASRIVCDSRILQRLARLAGHDLPLVTGSDLVAALIARQAHDPTLHLLVVGSTPERVQTLKRMYPNLRLSRLDAPMGLATSPEMRAELARAIADEPFDVALLCVGSPAQERIAADIAVRRQQGGIALCVGAALDFLVGAQTRAPLLAQRLGLEWAWRLMREPRRMWRRYLVESPRIFALFLTDLRRNNRESAP